MQKLSKGATAEEFKAVVDEINACIVKYGWAGKKIYPYGRAEDLVEFMKHFEHYKEYTRSSKSLMVSELNGLVKIVEVWIKRENEPKVAVKLRNGKVKEVAKSVAEELVACECAQYC